MKPILCWIPILASLVLLAAETPGQIRPPRFDSRSVIFVASGAGNETNLADNLKYAITETRLTNVLRVEGLRWTRYDSFNEDYADRQSQANAARWLAQKIYTQRKMGLRCQIFVVGFCAGARIALEAVERQQPDTVDRVILLAPAVSSSYNLCGALAASGHGIDHFFSKQDAALANAEDALGTVEGKKGNIAGRFGFLPPPCPDYARRLRQYPWNDNFVAYGNQGGHYGWIHPNFVKNVVLAMIARDCRMSQPKPN